MSAMQVDVGSLSYDVQLVRGWVQYQGEPCYGLCDHLRRRILIADVLDPAQRIHVFVHELIHAWWQTAPGNVDATDEEAVADLAATAMTKLLLAIEGDPKLLEFFHARRGTAKLPVPLPDEDEEDADSVPARVQRIEAPKDSGAAGGTWVLRIFEPGDPNR